MANLTFPNNPVNGQKFTSNGKAFKYNSTTQRWSVSRAQLLGSLPDDVTIDAPTLSVSLSTIALDTVGANVYVTYTVDQDVKASITTSGIANSDLATITLSQSNNTITITAGTVAFANGQINLVVTNGRSTDTETINVSAVYATFDLANATLDYTASFASGSVEWNNDGTVYYGIASVAQIGVYTCSTPYDLSTINNSSAVFLPSAYQKAEKSLRFSTNGEYVYILKGSPYTLYRLTLDTPWDLSTANAGTAQAISSDNRAGNDYSNDIKFSPDGTKIFWISQDCFIAEYPLSTPWDLSTMGSRTVNNALVGTGRYPGADGFDIIDSGTKILVITGESFTVRLYEMSTPWDLSTMGSAVASFSGISGSRKVGANPNGGLFQTGKYGVGTTYQFTM